MDCTALLAQLDAQAASLEEIFAAIDTGDDLDGDDPHEALCEHPLEVKKVVQVCVVLATGGPHVEITAELDEETFSLTQARLCGYWGDEQVERRVDEGSAVFRALDTYAEALVA